VLRAYTRIMSSAVAKVLFLKKIKFYAAKLDGVPRKHINGRDLNPWVGNIMSV